MNRRAAFLFLFLLSLASCTAAATGDIDTIQAFVVQNNLEEASQRLERYLGDYPKDPRARFLRGVLLAERNEVDRAIRAFTELIAEYPHLPEPYNNLAVLEAARGDYTAAREALLSALNTNSTYGTVHENLDDIYKQMAKLAYAKAVDPDAAKPVANADLVLLERLGASRTRRIAAVPGTVTMLTKRDTRDPQFSSSEQIVVGSAVGTSSQSEATDEVLSSVKAWANAWSSQDVEAYLGFYGHHFSLPDGLSRSAWESARRRRIEAPSLIEISIGAPQVNLVETDRARVSFLQQYRSNTYEDQVLKTLWMSRLGQSWKIVREMSRKK